MIGTGFEVAEMRIGEVVLAQKTVSESVSVKQYLMRARSWRVMEMQIMARRILSDIQRGVSAARTFGPSSSISRSPCQQVRRRRLMRLTSANFVRSEFDRSSMMVICSCHMTASKKDRPFRYLKFGSNRQL